MPQIPAQYEELQEFNDIAQSLIDKYPQMFGYTNLNNIACVSITNKERPEKKQKMWEIKTISAPVDMYCNKEYIVVLYSHDWDAMDKRYKALLVCDVMLSISPEGDGKVIPFDMKDHSTMLRTFGVDYMQNPNVENILEKDIEWRSI